MAPNLKRNKTPIVLSCIDFHWKTTIFLHSPFTFRYLQKWCLIFWSAKYMVMDDPEYVTCWAQQFPWLSRPCTGLIQHSHPACTQVFACFGKETRSNLIPPGVLIDFTFLPVAGLSAWTCSGMFVSCFVGEKSVYCWELNRSCRWLGHTHFWVLL